MGHGVGDAGACRARAPGYLSVLHAVKFVQYTLVHAALEHQATCCRAREVSRRRYREYCKRSAGQSIGGTWSRVSSNRKPVPVSRRRYMGRGRGGLLSPAHDMLVPTRLGMPGDKWGEEFSLLLS
jgi:hypothetical protein